jgi:hypothetical protein
MHRTRNRSCPWWPGGGTDDITEILNNNARFTAITIHYTIGVVDDVIIPFMYTYNMVVRFEQYL